MLFSLEMFITSKQSPTKSQQSFFVFIFSWWNQHSDSEADMGMRSAETIVKKIMKKHKAGRVAQAAKAHCGHGSLAVGLARE